MYTEGVSRRLIERERSKYPGECEGSASALDNDQDRSAAIDTNDSDIMIAVFKCRANVCTSRTMPV